MSTSADRPSATGARERLLRAAFDIVRTKGYNATTVDDLCAAAGVSKGSFFHHFSSKEDLAIAAADHWSEVTGALFAAAPYHALPDARSRVLGYVDFRAAILQGEVAAFTCLVGTLVQEVYESSPAIREACARSIGGHAALLEADIAQALAESRHGQGVDAPGLALHTQAVLQGAFVLAKAHHDAAVAAASIAHLHAYLDYLFEPAPAPKGVKVSRSSRADPKTRRRRQAVGRDDRTHPRSIT